MKTIILSVAAFAFLLLNAVAAGVALVFATSFHW